MALSIFKKKKQGTQDKQEKKDSGATVAKKPFVQSKKREGGLLKNVLIKPIITEKATNLTAGNQYVFLVTKDANKNLVKENIAYKYNVKVKKVNIVKIKGKTKYFKNQPSKTKDIKKAIVFLKSGEKIDIQ
jgi:large subunit ribosomal protein L23